jgi:hypothetical protein
MTIIDDDYIAYKEAMRGKTRADWTRITDEKLGPARPLRPKEKLPADLLGIQTGVMVWTSWMTFWIRTCQEGRS